MDNKSTKWSLNIIVQIGAYVVITKGVDLRIIGGHKKTGGLRDVSSLAGSRGGAPVEGLGEFPRS